MDRRAIIARDRPDLIARQDMRHHFVVLQAVHKLREQPRSSGPLAVRCVRNVEQLARVFRLVQIVAELPFVILLHELRLLFRTVQPRPHVFQGFLEVPEAVFNVCQRGLYLRRIGR